jgi:hypothetical protein
MATDLRRDVTPVRLPNPSAQPFATALKTARFFAVVFFWVTMVALVAHLASFVMVEWVRFFDVPEGESAASPAARSSRAPLLPFEGTALAAGAPEAPPPKAPAAPPKPTAAGAPEAPPPKAPAAPPKPPAAGAPEAPPPKAPAAPPKPPAAAPETPGTPAVKPEPQVPETPEKKEPAPGGWLDPRKRGQYRVLTERLIEPLRALGMLAAILLWVTMFIYLEIGLLGRLSGIREVTGAFFVMLLVLATVLPWHNWFKELNFGSFYRFSDLWEAHQDRLAGRGLDALASVWFYARFLVMPMVSTALLVIAGLRFGRGYVESVVVNE